MTFTDLNTPGNNNRINMPIRQFTSMVSQSVKFKWVPNTCPK